MSDADELRQGIDAELVSLMRAYGEYGPDGYAWKRIIDAIDAAGWQVVPKEPTDEMVKELILQLYGEEWVKEHRYMEFMHGDGVDLFEDDRQKLKAALAAAPKVTGDE
jgi:hypothetical protein